MEFIKSKIKLAVLVFVVFTGTNCAADPFTMEISTSQAHIKVGEPLLISLVRHHQEPQISEVTGYVKSSINARHFHLEVLDANDKSIKKAYKPMPIRLMLQGTKGLEYKGAFDVFYDDSVGLVFDKPGIYNVCLLSPSGKYSSNSLEIMIEPPSEAEEKALSFFAGVEDFAFLMGGIFKNEQTVSHLGQAADRSGDTILGKWSAARLGIEYFKEFHKQHRSFEKFKAKKQKNEVDSLLFDKAYDYLKKGSALPDEFSIRGEVLDNLIVTEYINGNYQKAIRLAEELESKYPYSEYGQKASRAKKELRELEEAEKGKK